MRTIVHLSDLHFGAIIPATLDPLVADVQAIDPDLVVVSGDMTQRAREAQFREAAAYLARLPRPQLLIPGNHDVPLYDVARRFLHPLGRYRRHITQDLAPVFADDEMLVVGINTARSLVFKGGRISRAQTDAVCESLDRAGDRARIVVTHHPFDIPPHLSGVRPVMGGRHAITRMAAHGTELVLSGHLHLVHVTATSSALPSGVELPLLVAGTPTSTRARRETNSFFVIRVERDAFHVETRRWLAEREEFVMAECWSFTRGSPARQPSVAVSGARFPTEDRTVR